MSEHYAADQILGHADEADGIEEYDNRLPTWWLGMFVFCVAWAPIYAVHYHLVAQKSQSGDYLAEVAAAAERWPQASAEEVANMVVTDEVLAEGETIYKTNCIACHGAELNGGIGANLMDEEWIHGNSKAEIIATVTAGVPDKGMPPWGPILGPEKVAKVSAFIHVRAVANVE